MKELRPSGEGTLELEREVLRAMCQLAPGRSGQPGTEPMRRLARYRFRDPVHQLIFDTLCELQESVPAGSNAWPATIREHLASRLTLKGFPEFDIDLLFLGNRVEEGELRRCISGLTAAPESR